MKIPPPDRLARPITRHDVALRAGVSDPVVSYTLNGRKPVAPATAARVLEAVSTLGYTPNTAARALKSGSAKLIGIIVPDSTNPFWAELCRAVETVAGLQGYSVLVVNSHQDAQMTLRHIRDLGSRQVDGVMIASTIRAEDVAELNATGVRWAGLNQASPVVGVHWAGVDLEAGAHLATDHLISVHRYSRIAFVGQNDDQRFLGWENAIAGAGLRPGPVFASPFTREGGYAAGRSIAALHESIDAAFASSDLIASGMLLALHEAGISIPEDVAIASFDGSPESGYTWPPLTTVRQPIEKLAERAFSDLLRSEPTSHQFSLLSGELSIRQSCGCTRSVP